MCGGGHGCVCDFVRESAFEVCVCVCMCVRVCACVPMCVHLCVHRSGVRVEVKKGNKGVFFYFVLLLIIRRARYDEDFNNKIRFPYCLQHVFVETTKSISHHVSITACATTARSCT